MFLRAGPMFFFALTKVLGLDRAYEMCVVHSAWFWGAWQEACARGDEEDRSLEERCAGEETGGLAGASEGRVLGGKERRSAQSREMEDGEGVLT